MNGLQFSFVRRLLPAIRLGLLLAGLVAVAPSAQSASAWRPIADARNANAVWMVSATLGVAVGDAGLIMRTTDGGVNWASEDGATSVNLHDVWAADATHIWAVGDSGVIVFWNGIKWTAQSSGIGSSNLLSVYGTSATNVFASGTAGTIRRFNGSLWSGISTGILENLNGIWAADASNIWFVGDAGKILKWNGSAISTQSSGVTSKLNGVGGANSTNVWAVGAGGVVRFFNGTSWAGQTSGTTDNLVNVSAANANHVWAVSTQGSIFFYDGITWAKVFTTAAPVRALHGVCAQSTTVILAVGDASTAVVGDGTNWADSFSDTPAVSWNGIWGLEDSDMWIVGNGGNICHWNGKVWTSTPSGTTQNLARVFGVDGSNIWAVGAAGTILKYDGATWTSQGPGGAVAITGVWAASSSQAWACTANRTILHYNGTTWTVEYSAATDPLYAIWGFNASNVWAAGRFTNIARRLNTNWTNDNINGSTDKYAAWGSALDAVWVVGGSGTILKNVGSVGDVWIPQNAPTSQDFRGVGGVDKNNVWAAGGTAIYRFNGTQWLDDMPSKNVRGATGLWATGLNAVFVTTSDGVVFVNSPATVGEISVEHPLGVTIPSKTTVDFGSIDAPAVVTKTFNINSSGLNPLTGLVVTKSGTGAADFTVGALGSTTVASGNSTTFDVTFLPTADGTRTASLSLASNDADESPFIINLTGVGRLPPTITTQPVSKTVSPNAAAIFTVAAKGTATLSFLWQKYNTTTMVWDPAPGANTATTYKINSAQQLDEGKYRVQITNPVTVTSGMPVYSNEVILTVNDLVVLVAPFPAPVAKRSGETASFTVNVDPSTTTPITYKWLRGTTTVSTVVSSDHFNTLTIPSVAITHGGEYKCVVTNIANFQVTTGVQLSVVDSVNRKFVQSIGATPAFTAAVGGAGLTYLWKKNGGPLPADPDYIALNNKLTIKTLVLGDDAVYTCDVTGPGGTVTSGDFDLIVYDTAPALKTGLTLPLDMGTTIVGDTYSFSIPDQLDPATNKTPTTYAAAPLPPGIKCDPVTGIISGKAALTLTADKIYNVVITALNAKGKINPLITATLTVKKLPDNLAGAYSGPIERQSTVNNGLGGRVDLTITTAGTYTGKVTLGAAAALPFAGSVETAVGSTIATGSAVILRKAPLSNLTVGFTIDTLLNKFTVGTVFDGTNTANFTGWRNVWTTTVPAAGYVGYHTFKLAAAAGAGIPEGEGYGYFTVAPTGALVVVGKLADGIPLATSTFAGPGGEVLLFQASATVDAIVGNLDMSAGTLPLNADSTLIGNGITWSRFGPQAAAVHIYNAGFAPVAVSAGGGRYLPKVAPAFVLGISADTGVDNAQINFTGAELGDGAKNPAPLPDVTARISSPAKVNPIPFTPTRATTLAVNAATGVITGTFKLVDARDPLVTTGLATVTRTVTYYGIIVPGATDPEGHGFFLLPKRPTVNGQTIATTDQLSGKVVVKKL